MNIYSHKKELQQFLLETTNKKKFYSGCYIISRVEESKEFKLGMSTSLYERLTKQYMIAMSHEHEFWVHYLVLCPREFENRKSYAKIMETELLKAIEPTRQDTTSYSDEYFVSANLPEIEPDMLNVLKNYKKYYMTALKFVKDGFYLFNRGKFQGEKLNFDKLPSFNPDVNEVLDVSNTLKGIPSQIQSNTDLNEITAREKQRLIDRENTIQKNSIDALASVAKAEARRIKLAENKIKRDAKNKEQKKQEQLLKNPILTNIPKKSKKASTEKSTRLGRAITKPARYRD